MSSGLSNGTGQPWGGDDPDLRDAWNVFPADELPPEPELPFAAFNPEPFFSPPDPSVTRIAATRNPRRSRCQTATKGSQHKKSRVPFVNMSYKRRLLFTGTGPWLHIPKRDLTEHQLGVLKVEEIDGGVLGNCHFWKPFAIEWLLRNQANTKKDLGCIPMNRRAEGFKHGSKEIFLKRGTPNASGLLSNSCHTAAAESRRCVKGNRRAVRSLPAGPDRLGIDVEAGADRMRCGENYPRIPLVGSGASIGGDFRPPSTPVQIWIIPSSCRVNAVWSAN
ncbi:hypothetical protein DFH09DRAFT_1090702 [Mycena vulgaris]|nr:hypothetical protein DFH09DRAFT_1090702 [Mycena vulgaris]